MSCAIAPKLAQKLVTSDDLSCNRCGLFGAGSGSDHDFAVWLRHGLALVCIVPDKS